MYVWLRPRKIIVCLGHHNPPAAAGTGLCIAAYHSIQRPSIVGCLWLDGTEEFGISVCNLQTHIYLVTSRTIFPIIQSELEPSPSWYLKLKLVEFDLHELSRLLLRLDYSYSCRACIYIPKSDLRFPAFWLSNYNHTKRYLEPKFLTFSAFPAWFLVKMFFSVVVVA